MKKILLLFTLFTAFLFFKQAEAQVKVSVNINVNTQPAWGPQGYDYVDYYYLPDVDVYYYVPQHRFIYFTGGRWIFAASLPPRCASYDLYRGYKVIINEQRPYLRHNVYRVQYAKYKECYDRQPPLHGRGKKNGFKDNDGPGNGHGRGHAYGHDKKHRDD